PRRRVDPHVPAPRNRATHDRGESTRRVDWRGAPRLDDGSRNPARKAFFAVSKNGVGQLAFGGAGYEIGRRLACAGVHAHVERLVPLKTEPSAWRVQLQRRNAEIG